MENKSQQKSLYAKWLIIVAFGLVVIAFFSLDLGRDLSLNSLKENKDVLRSYTESHYPWVVLLYILTYIAQTTFSLPGAAILTLTGGFLFGTLLGALYANVGATVGAVLAFIAARFLFHDWVERTFGQKLGGIQEGFAKNAFHYLLTIRLIPVFPFFLVNLASGLTRMHLPTYVVATAVGILPGSLVYSNAGKQLGTINSLDDIASPGVIGAFVLLGLLALVPVLYQKIKNRSSDKTVLH